MEMIQNAMMFQDAAPAALPQPGRGAATATDGGGSGGFAELLQNSGGLPASAAGAAQDPQALAADSAGARTGTAGQPAAQAPGVATGADRWKMFHDLQRNSLAAEAQESTALTDAQQGRGGSAATAEVANKVLQPVFGRATGSDPAAVRTVAARKSLAAEAQESGPYTVAAQGGVAGLLLASAKDAEAAGSASDAALGTGQAGVPSAGNAGNAAAVPAGELVAAQSGAAVPAGAGPATGAGAPGVQQGPPNGAAVAPVLARVAAFSEAALPDAAGKVIEAAPAAKEAAPKGAAAKAVPMKADAARQAGQGSSMAPRPVPEAAAAAKDAAAAVQGPVAAGKSQGTDAAAPQQAKPGPASAGTEAGPVVVLQKGSGMDNAALDKLRSASPGAVADGLQNADAKGEVVRPVTTGAPEKEQGVAAASDGKTAGSAVTGPAATPGQVPQPGGTEAASSDVTPLPDRFAQGGADGSKGPRAALGFHGTYGAARGAAEQTGGKPDAPVEGAAGIKTASAAGGVKFVPFQGSAGQDGSSDGGKQGGAEQKAQTGPGATVQPQGAGLPAAAASELPQPEAKAVNLKSALHESILAQVKDGVVTHDDKGNSQISIRLNPGELGELKIQVRMDDNRLHVEVQADNKMVKDLLMSNLDSLKDSLTAKNFSMEGFDVSTGSGGFNSPLPEQKGNPQQQNSSRYARAGGYPDQGEPGRVNYLTGEVNNLLDVRF